MVWNLNSRGVSDRLLLEAIPELNETFPDSRSSADSPLIIKVSRGRGKAQSGKKRITIERACGEISYFCDVSFCAAVSLANRFYEFLQAKGYGVRYG